jgi:hypothetical protein
MIFHAWAVQQTCASGATPDTREDVEMVWIETAEGVSQYREAM